MKTKMTPEPVIEITGPVLVQAKYSRPSWCRDDWCLVRLENGYRFYMHTRDIVFGESDECWIRATAWTSNRYNVEVRYDDIDGEGTADGVSRSLVVWLDSKSHNGETN